MTPLSPGDYSSIPAIHYNTLITKKYSIKQNLAYAELQQSNVLKIAVTGTITTIALAIFAAPVFAIIAGLSTFVIMSNFFVSSKDAKKEAHDTENYLNNFIITQNDRNALGDTYTNFNLLNDNNYQRFKVKDVSGKVVFYDVSMPSVILAYQDHDKKSWARIQKITPMSETEGRNGILVDGDAFDQLQFPETVVVN